MLNVGTKWRKGVTKTQERRNRGDEGEKGKEEVEKEDDISRGFLGGT